MGFAMQLTAFRFSVRSMMLAVGGAALVLAYLGSYHAKNGCGYTNALTEFQVVDDQDGRPVAGAKVDLFTDMADPAIASAITGLDGSAEITCLVGSTSYTGSFLRSYRYLSWTYGLRIEANGYQNADEFLHRGWKHVGQSTPVSPTFVIRLKRSAKSISSR
jgi:hypothetical protein